MINLEFIFGQFGKGLDKFIAFLISLPWYLQVIIVLLIVIAVFVIQNRLRYT